MTSFDTLIRHGTLIDGTGAPRFDADLGVRGDRIAAIGDLRDATAPLVIEALGKVVAPGFIDVHNHSDGWLLREPNFAPKTSQGFTTELLMADGISYAPVDERTAPEWIYYVRALNGLQFQHYGGWRSVRDYGELLHGRTAQNSMLHLPYGNVRSLVAGFGRLPLDDFQMRAAIWQVEEAMEAGAVGLSTGLDYLAQACASTDELVEVCRALAPWHGVYVSHVRYLKGTLPGVQEAVEIGRRAGVPVHVSHMKATNQRDTDALLRYVDTVAANEVDFSFDVYPYLPGCTMLNYMLPYEVFDAGPLAVAPRLLQPQVRAQFARSLAAYPLENVHIAWLPGRENGQYVGWLLSDYVAAVGKPPAAALAELLIEENLAVLLVFHHGDDALVEPFLAHDRCMLSTDGIYFPDAAVHPRVYGSTGRLLGRCARDRRLFSLEQAVRKLTGFPAERFGVRGRGVLAEGNFADIVVFDPRTVADRATYERPHERCTGIEQVLVNGVRVIRDGQPADDLAPPPGRFLRSRA